MWSEYSTLYHDLQSGLTKGLALAEWLTELFVEVPSDSALHRVLSATWLEYVVAELLSQHLYTATRTCSYTAGTWS